MIIKGRRQLHLLSLDNAHNVYIDHIHKAMFKEHEIFSHLFHSRQRLKNKMGGIKMFILNFIISFFSSAKHINKIISMKESYFERKHEKLRSSRSLQKQRKERNWLLHKAEAKQP